jgi:hypothetical protein
MSATWTDPLEYRAMPKDRGPHAEELKKLLGCSDVRTGYADGDKSLVVEATWTAVTKIELVQPRESLSRSMLELAADAMKKTCVPLAGKPLPEPRTETRADGSVWHVFDFQQDTA